MDTATTKIYTLSLHDALPISCSELLHSQGSNPKRFESQALRIPSASNPKRLKSQAPQIPSAVRSEEHTSELQSLAYLVCRLLLEQKKNNTLPPHSVRSDPITF